MALAFESGPKSNVFVEAVCDRVRKISLSLVNRPYRREQFAAQHVLVEIRLRANGQRSPDAVVIRQSGNDNESRGRKLFFDHGNDFFSADDGQIPVHDRHIRLKRLELFNGLMAVTGLTYDSHVGLGVDHGTNAVSHPGVIVNDQDSDLPCVRKHEPD
jgi:hypothetical protein